MATVVGWSPHAEEQFRKILSELYDRSPEQAEKWSDELLKKINLLESFPEMGRLAPTHGLYFYRQILVGQYRVRYAYFGNSVTIASIRHQAGDSPD